MSITDFILSIGSSVLGNLLTPKRSIPPEQDGNKGTSLTTEPAADQPRRLAVRPIADTASWARFGERLRNLLLAIDKPNVYLLIESEPSTAYTLVTVVVEDSRTQDWYPFEQNIAFEGTGGGWQTAKQVDWEIKEAKRLGADVRVSIRVAHSADLSGLISGNVTWNALKERSVPALISAETHYWALQERFTSEVLNNKPSGDA